jgi:Heterokaryon incompatibility protein (HET)
MTRRRNPSLADTLAVIVDVIHNRGSMRTFEKQSGNYISGVGLSVGQAEPDQNDSISPVEEAFTIFSLRRGPDPHHASPKSEADGSGFHAFQNQAADVPFYSPIGEKDIRLLSLTTAGKGRNDVLHCKIQLYSFKDTQRIPQYAAISYVCGDPNNRMTIICNGQERSIRSSLYGALKRLQQQILPDKSALLWADELCINQDDVKEFSSQVSRMRDIYESAFAVFIWLGEEDRDTPRVWRLLSWVRTHIEVGRAASMGPEFSLIENEAKLSLDLTFPSELDVAGLQVDRASEPLEAFYAIFQNEWFHRKWTFQESSIARRALFICGSYGILYERLINIAARLNVGIHDLAPSAQDKVKIEAVVSLRVHGSVRNNPNRLSTLLKYTRQRKAANPRDMIFSLVGLTRGAYRHELKTDYSLEIEAVYRAAATISFLEDKDLDLLDCTCHPVQSGLPSWVPDWRHPAPATWIDCKSSFQVDFVKKPSVQICDRGQSLVVAGVIVGRIGQISAHNSSSDAASCDQFTITRRIPGWETMGRWGPPRVQPVGPGIVRVGDVAAKIRSSIETPDDYTSRPWELAGPGASRTGAISGIIDICNVFTTTEGKNVGLCPQKARVDDVVCILFGSRVPYVLRPWETGKSDDEQNENLSRRGTENPRYMLIGSCYLHGCMGGELLNGRTQDRVDEISFKIQ